MATLIAVDGHSLNMGLQRIAKIQNDNGARFRIDHGELAQFLRQYGDEDDVSLCFYADAEESDASATTVMGKVTKYFANKGYGFISATDGNSYFFHNNEVINKKHLCNPHEDRYPHPTSPEFQRRIVGKVVTFRVVTEEEKTRAEEIHLELGARSLDQYYRLRREPFLQMLSTHGYDIIRCKPSYNSGKAKSIDVQICLDASWEIADEDTFVLLSDDVIFSDLIVRLREAETSVVLATFDSPSSQDLRDVVEAEGGKVVLLDDHLDDLELVFEQEPAFEREQALQEA